MKKIAKRGLSWLMALVMALTIAVTPGMIAYAASVDLSFNGATVSKSDADQTIEVSLVAASAFDCNDVGAVIKAGSPLVITDIKGESGTSIWSEYNDVTGELTHFPDPVGMEDVSMTTILTVVVKIPAGTEAGSYTVTISDLMMSHDPNTFDEYTGFSSTQIATIKVEEPSSTPAYELYYVLDKSGDSDSDKYVEYNPGDTVTATVYMKAKAADTLQAFDFVVTNDSNLEYKSYSSSYGTRIESGTAKSTAISQHIQAVGADKTNPINVALPAGEGVAIATITYKVKEAAVYNVGLPITIQNNANIAVANKAAAFYPEIQSASSDTLGAETLKTYTVSYDANGGTGAPATQTKQHNVALTLSGTEPTREGYTFQGWSKTSGDSNSVNYGKGASFAENADTTLYAVWQANTHKVEWKSQDGTTTYETDNEVAFNTALSYDGTAPTKEADAQYTYTFAGWSTSMNAETGAAANSFTMGDEDMGLYAAFSKETNKYTVTWKSQDGATTLETDAEVAYGTQPEFNATEPTKAADETYTYSFAGWATSANQENGTAAASLPTVGGDATYYAAFSKTFIDYTITYALGDHPADGATAPAADSKHYNDSITLPAGPAAADGYTFAGWSDGTNTYGAGDSYTVTGTATLTAVYTENTYNVVYDANGGTGTVPVSHNNVKYTDSIIISDGDSLTKNGYTFAGWNTVANGTGNAYSAGASVSKLSATNGATVTLFAQWTEAAYTITYDYDDATTIPSNPTGYDVGDLPITLTQPEKTGYAFDGWTFAVETGETGNVVTSGNEIQTGTYGNLTVKANWTPAEVTYTVKHYQQNIDNDDYTEVTADAQSMTGTTGEQTAAVAKTYTGFTVKSFSQTTIAADGSTVVSIYYDRNLHRVTYAYTGTAPAGAPVVPAAIENVKFGATVTLTAVAPTLDHYDFSGWSKTGSFTMEDTDVEITGSWTEHSYIIKFWNLEEGETGNTVLYEKAYTESTQSEIAVPTVPTKDWYDANGWTAYTLFSADEINVYPQYTKHTYTITFQDENGTDLSDQGSDPNFGVDDKSITPPAVPEKPGYTGAWPTLPTDTPADASVQPVYTAVEYTITFETDGGDAIANMTYTIESPDVLPSATGKANFTFDKWKVTTADGNWAADSAINGGTAVTGKYGNVTLTAQWTQSLSYAVQEYKYAPTGYKLLIVDAAGAGEGKVYTYDGVPMYYTEDANYQINGSTGVFYTLVPAASTSLTDAEVAKITASAGEKATITYDGDVNGDGKINIADANAIFQMVVATGSYYGTDQLSIAQRLAADMVKSTENAEHRGSIEDVNAVVAIINGTN